MHNILRGVGSVITTGIDTAQNLSQISQKTFPVLKRVIQETQMELVNCLGLREAPKPLKRLFGILEQEHLMMYIFFNLAENGDDLKRLFSENRVS